VLRAARPAAPGRPLVWLDLLPCTGLYLERLAQEAPQAELHFIELSAQTADFVRRRLPADRPGGPATYHLYQGAIPLPTGSVDVATCAFRLEGLPRPEQERLLREVARVLRPGGLLGLAHINRDSYFTALRLARWLLGRRDVQYVLATDPSLGPFAPLAVDEAVGLARQAGLVVLEQRGLFPLPPEDEARFRVRSLRRPLDRLAEPVRLAYRLTRPLHGLLGRFGKVSLLRLRRP